jgi:hypothetical protein
MALTIAAMEEELIEELRPYMAITKMDVSTKDGNNVSLRSVIRRAIEACGGSIADFPYVTDADIATITAGAGRLWLVARIYLLEKVWDHWAKFDERKGDTDQKLREVAKDLAKRVDTLKEELANPEEAGGVAILPSAPEVGEISAGSDIPHDPFRWGFSRRPFPY